MRLKNVNEEFIFNNTGNIFVQPLRWCYKNISRFKDIPEGSIFLKTVKKIAYFIPAFFSVILVPLLYPLASLGMSLELKKGISFTDSLKLDPKDLQNTAQKQLTGMTSEQLDQDWKLKEFFGQIYVINLEKAKDKRELFISNAKKIGLNEEDFKFFKATYGRTDLDPSVWKRVDNNYCGIDINTAEGKAALDKQHQGQAGCFMSHYRAIKEAKRIYEEAQNRVKESLRAYLQCPSQKLLKQIDEARIDLQKKSRVFIMEDDNAFGSVISDELVLHEYNRFGNSATVEGLGKVFREGILELPADWEMLYLHTFQMFPLWENAREENAKICKLKGCWTCNAYVVNASAFDKILKRLEKIEKGNAPLYPVDDEFASMHKEGYLQAYGFHPSITYQNCMGQSSIADGGDQTAAKKNCWQQTECGRPVVTYVGEKRSFGKQLIDYINALYLATYHKIPLTYRPFEFSDKLRLSKTHFPHSNIEKKYWVITNKLKDTEKSLSITEKLAQIEASTKFLLKDIVNWKEKISLVYEISSNEFMDFSKFDNENFRVQLLSLIKPDTPLRSLEIPKNCCSVALHVRAKLAPDEFYLKAIKYIAEQNKGKKLFIHIFTDEVNAGVFKERYDLAIKQWGLDNPIEWAFRKEKSKDGLDVLEDFFAMTQFDCLVRGESSFALAVEILSAPRLSIVLSKNEQWRKKNSSGPVDKFEVNMRAEKGKGKAQARIVSI